MLKCVALPAPKAPPFACRFPEHKRRRTPSWEAPGPEPGPLRSLHPAADAPPQSVRLLAGRGDPSERNCTTARRSNPGKSILESKGLPTSSVTTRRPATSQVTASLAGAGGRGARGHRASPRPRGNLESRAGSWPGQESPGGIRCWSASIAAPSAPRRAHPRCGRTLRVDGDHLPAAAPDQEDPVQPLSQDLEELHVWGHRVKDKANPTRCVAERVNGAPSPPRSPRPVRPWLEKETRTGQGRPGPRAFGEETASVRKRGALTLPRRDLSPPKTLDRPGSPGYHEAQTREACGQPEAQNPGPGCVPPPTSSCPRGTDL